ncbi:GGDEF domain-containing protein [Acidovorax sp. FJL06]|uniref:GGDEF domain-containing protein n=1 Tax=Acidovorax sp. FJL06 TaxID=2153365 RepID=UPI00131531B2|nr:diguanylate cyclase [Acidovorax sp. FJL06]
MKSLQNASLDATDIVDNLLTVGIVVVDRRFTVIMWNRFMELNSNLRAEDILGKNLFDVFPELNRNWLEKKIRSCLVLRSASFSSWQQRPYLFRFKASNMLSLETDHMYQDAAIFPVRDAAGLVEGACIAIHDVTELAEAKRLLDLSLDQALDLEESNRRDALTGLFNRKFFDEQISQEVVTARRHNRPLALAMIDIDHFKTINDTYGHVAGDRVLRALATLLNNMLRGSDYLCRYGGEEFGLILPQISPEHAGILLERLRKAVENADTLLDDGVTVVKLTISVGVMPLREGVAPGTMVRMADELLYASKQAGRNCVSLYKPEVAPVPTESR